MIKRRKWYIHFDHWWSEDVVSFGAPIRLYITTPWVFIIVGTKSQRWTPKGGYSKTKWDYISFRPIRGTPKG